MQIGASFSNPHLTNLELEPIKAIKAFKILGLGWIRLGCYWNEIEEKKGKYKFTRLDPIVKYCDNNNISIVMTLGMKAPRWPEYYIPSWLENKLNIKKHSVITPENTLLFEKTMAYIEEVVLQYKGTPSLKVWQIENEPFYKSGMMNWKLSSSFLDQETQLVKSLDPDRKILINVWANELIKTSHYKLAEKLAPLVGLNIYPREAWSEYEKTQEYAGPQDSKEEIKRIANRLNSEGKKIWITELQAEPWEPNEIVSTKKNPPSFLPKHFESNFKYADYIKPEVTLLWGYEYWYWRREKINDNRYWNAAVKAIRKRN